MEDTRYLGFQTHVFQLTTHQLIILKRMDL